MSRIKVRRQIEIERNVIEKFLMDVKDFLKENRKLVILSLSGVAVLSALIMAVVVIVGSINERNLVRLEKIMEKYQDYTNEEYKLEQKEPGAKGPDEAAVKAHQAKADEIIGDLKKLVDSSYFGFSHTMAYYVLGNMYFSAQKYKEARENLVEFADSSSSSSVFVPMALVKAAVAAQEEGDMKAAQELFEDLEKDYASSAVADQIFYYMGGFYQKKGDSFKAKEYYNKVVSGYAASPFAQKAKKEAAFFDEFG